MGTDTFPNGRIKIEGESTVKDATDSWNNGDSYLWISTHKGDWNELYVDLEKPTYKSTGFKTQFFVHIVYKITCKTSQI